MVLTKVQQVGLYARARARVCVCVCTNCKDRATHATTLRCLQLGLDANNVYLTLNTLRMTISAANEVQSSRSRCFLISAVKHFLCMQANAAAASPIQLGQRASSNFNCIHICY